MSFVSYGSPLIIWTTVNILLSCSFFNVSSKHFKSWHLLINLEVLSCIVCKPNSIVKNVLLFNSFKYSKHSSDIASGLVAIESPTTLGCFKIASYFSFSISTGAYVLVLAWN